MRDLVPTGRAAARVPGRSPTRSAGGRTGSTHVCSVIGPLDELPGAFRQRKTAQPRRDDVSRGGRSDHGPTSRPRERPQTPSHAGSGTGSAVAGVARRRPCQRDLPSSSCPPRRSCYASAPVCGARRCPEPGRPAATATSKPTASSGDRTNRLSSLRRACRLSGCTTLLRHSGRQRGRLGRRACPPSARMAPPRRPSDEDHRSECFGIRFADPSSGEPRPRSSGRAGRPRGSPSRRERRPVESEAAARRTHPEETDDEIRAVERPAAKAVSRSRRPSAEQIGRPS